jgi:hypothetical protein
MHRLCYSWRSLLAFLWLGSSLTLSGAVECRRWEFSTIVGPPSGYSLYQGTDCCRAYLYDPATLRWWQSSRIVVTIGSEEFAIAWSGVSGPGSYIPDLEMCLDPVLVPSAPLTSEWQFLGWDDSIGGWTLFPEGEGWGGVGEDLILSHGTHASATGTGCGDCSGGGGDPDPEVTNTNQFHLDVTNALAGISERLDTSLQYQTGGVPDSVAEGLSAGFQSRIGELTNGVNDQLVGLTNFLGTNFVASGGLVSAPGLPPGDLMLSLPTGDTIPLFAWLAEALTPFHLLGAFLRFSVTLMLSGWVNLTIMRECLEAARTVVQSRSQTTSSGGAVPGLSAIIGITFAAIIIAMALALPASMSALGEAQRIAVVNEGGDALGGGDAVLGTMIGSVFEAASLVPYVGHFLFLTGYFLPYVSIAAVLANWGIYVSIRRFVLLGVQAVIRFFP